MIKCDYCTRRKYPDDFALSLVTSKETMFACHNCMAKSWDNGILEDLVSTCIENYSCNREVSEVVGLSYEKKGAEYQ